MYDKRALLVVPGEVESAQINFTAHYLKGYLCTALIVASNCTVQNERKRKQMELQKLEIPKFRSVMGRSVQSNNGSVRDCTDEAVWTGSQRVRCVCVSQTFVSAWWWFNVRPQKWTQALTDLPSCWRFLWRSRSTERVISCRVEAESRSLQEPMFASIIGN